MIGKLQFQGEKSRSIAPKGAIISFHLVCISAAAWLTFSPAGIDNQPGGAGRIVLLLACMLFYVVRMTITLFVFVKRRIPWWEAVWGGTPIGLVLFVFLLEGSRAWQPLGSIDAVWLLFYLVGSYLGSVSEYSRHVWKARPENKGHIYTEGLFKHCRHINYFGDLLLFFGLGLLTRHMWTPIVPMAMCLNFVFFIIPAHDAYLAARYGDEFDEYARRSWKLVPFLY